MNIILFGYQYVYVFMILHTHLKKNKMEKLQKSLRCKVLWTMEKFCQKIQYTQTEISEIWGWK